jgi:hypothetical protein
MRRAKEEVFRLRIASPELARIKRVARARGEPASAWLRRIADAEARREEAALRVVRHLDDARRSDLPDEEAMALVDAAVHADRRRR